MKYIIISFSLIILSFYSAISANLEGKIVGLGAESDTTDLIGATVKWEETNVGTISEKDGEFTIPRNNGEVKLIVSYIGYGKDTVEIPLEQDYVKIQMASSLQTEEVKVYGRQNVVISKSNIAKTESLTKSGLQKAACCSLGESFQTNASVDVEYSDAVSGAKKIMMLGLDGKYTQMLTEKVPNLRGIGSSYGLSYIPGQWMESIQISKGAASVQTGYESTTGQINVEFDKPLEGNRLFMNLFGNHLGRFDADITSAYKLNDKLGTVLFLHGNTMQTKLDENGDRFLDLPMNDQVNVMNRWTYKDEIFHSQLVVKGLYEDREGGQKRYFDDENDGYYGMNINTERYEAYWKNGIIFPGESFKSLALILSASDHKQKSFFGATDYTGEQSSLYANLIYQFKLGGEEIDHSMHEHKTTMEEGESSASHEEHNIDMGDDDNSMHAENKTAAPALEHDISLGLSWQFDEYKEIFNSDDIFRTENVPGFFAEYSLSNLYGLTLVGGFRMDFHNLYGTFYTPRLHVKYDYDPTTIIRASVGKGYRVAHIYSENIGLMASSREFVKREKLEPEEAWNFGLNLTKDLYIGDVAFTLMADYYRTEFVNKTVVDLDENPGYAYFYNLDGISYSNSFQIDLIFNPLDNLEATAAYRLNDAKTTYDGDLLQKPLVNKHKVFLNLAYTLSEDWLFDFTVDFNGGGRLPNTSSNPAEYRLSDEYPAYALLHGQATKNFGDFSLYLGVENIGDFKQKEPILAYQNPFGEYFDSSIIWAPIVGRIVYAGMRMNLR